MKLFPASLLWLLYAVFTVSMANASPRYSPQYSAHHTDSLLRAHDRLAASMKFAGAVSWYPLRTEAAASSDLAWSIGRATFTFYAGSNPQRS